MKVLRIIAILLIVLVVAFAGFIFFQFQNARIVVLSVSTSGCSIDESPDDFFKWKAAINHDSFEGTVFRKPEEWSNPAEYVLITYTVELQNNCLLPIERVELQLEPQKEDIAQTGEISLQSVASGADGTVALTVLAQRESNTVRELCLSWYLWGKPFTQLLSSGQ